MDTAAIDHRRHPEDGAARASSNRVRAAFAALLSRAYWARVLRPVNNVMYLQYRPTFDRVSEPTVDPEQPRQLYDYLRHGQSTTDRYDLTRYYALFLQLRRIERAGIAGDLAELGVYRGDTAAFMRACSGRTLHLFDTWTGFDTRDTSIPGRPFGDVDEASVRRRIRGDTLFYPGYFPETAADLPQGRRFALVHIDMDLFKPILAALTVFYPRLTPGGAIVVHDYNNVGSWDEGARRAVDGFLADKPERGVELPDRYGSIIIIKHMTQAVAES